MYTLASRAALAATDGAPVPATSLALARIPSMCVAALIVTVTGTPTTYDMRAAIEVSPDGGTNWYQVLRFKDNTNAATPSQIVRIMGQAAASSADIVASVLGNAAAAAILVETPWPVFVRAVTKLQTLTGGTSPTVTATVLLDIT